MLMQFWGGIQGVAMIDREKFEQGVHLFKQSGQRTGQMYMNALWLVDREFHNEISFTEADCFYDDSHIPAFMLKVFGENIFSDKPLDKDVKM
jgi:hypothetical protein